MQPVVETVPILTDFPPATTLVPRALLVVCPVAVVRSQYRHRVPVRRLLLLQVVQTVLHSRDLRDDEKEVWV